MRGAAVLGFISLRAGPPGAGGPTATSGLAAGAWAAEQKPPHPATASLFPSDPLPHPPSLTLLRGPFGCLSIPRAERVSRKPHGGGGGVALPPRAGGWGSPPRPPLPIFPGALVLSHLALPCLGGSTPPHPSRTALPIPPLPHLLPCCSGRGVLALAHRLPSTDRAHGA